MQQGEPWEVTQKRLTSAQADAAAEALRARVAHFMAAQQAAGQPGLGSVPAAAALLPAGVAGAGVAVQPALQPLSSSPDTSQLPSNAPGEPQLPCYFICMHSAPSGTHYDQSDV